MASASQITVAYLGPLLSTAYTNDLFVEKLSFKFSSVASTNVGFLKSSTGLNGAVSASTYTGNINAIVNEIKIGGALYNAINAATSYKEDVSKYYLALQETVDNLIVPYRKFTNNLQRAIGLNATLPPSYDAFKLHIYNYITDENYRKNLTGGSTSTTSSVEEAMANAPAAIAAYGLIETINAQDTSVTFDSIGKYYGILQKFPR